MINIINYVDNNYKENKTNNYIGGTKSKLVLVNLLKKYIRCIGHNSSYQFSDRE